MPTVYSYYEPVPGMARPTRLLELWRESWEAKGWKTELLNEEHARAHPGYRQFSERISRYPTTNHPGYERACFMRHMAMASVSRERVETLVDYDVMNRGWSPDDAHIGPDSVISFIAILEPTRVPCVVLANQQGFGDLCDLIYGYKPNGEKHLSDMTILRNTQIQSNDSCVEHLCSGQPIPNHPGDGWKRAPMIHFSNYSFQKLGWKGDKADLIRKVLETL